MAADIQRLEATVRGYVQGVGFRMFVQRQALALGLTGWVRNRPDGSVSFVAEGPRSELLSLVNRVKDGPSEAEVQDVEVTWLPYTGGFSRFEVRL
jgi:acylphosphatase